MLNNASLPLFVALVIGLDWASRKALYDGDRPLSIAIGSVAILIALFLVVFLQVDPA